jgi:hypothetical protein
MANLAEYEIVDVAEQSHFHGEVRQMDATQDVRGGALFVCDSSGGSFTLTLPDAADFEGRILHFKHISANNSVTVDCTGGQTIDGAGSFSLSSQWAVKTVISDGSNWLTL